MKQTIRRNHNLLISSYCCRFLFVPILLLYSVLSIFFIIIAHFALVPSHLFFDTMNDGIIQSVKQIQPTYFTHPILQLQVAKEDQIVLVNTCFDSSYWQSAQQNPCETYWNINQTVTLQFPKFNPTILDLINYYDQVVLTNEDFQYALQRSSTKVVVSILPIVFFSFILFIVWIVVSLRGVLKYGAKIYFLSMCRGIHWLEKAQSKLQEIPYHIIHYSDYADYNFKLDSTSLDSILHDIPLHSGMIHQQMGSEEVIEFDNQDEQLVATNQDHTKNQLFAFPLESLETDRDALRAGYMLRKQTRNKEQEEEDHLQHQHHELDTSTEELLQHEPQLQEKKVTDWDESLQLLDDTEYIYYLHYLIRNQKFRTLYRIFSIFLTLLFASLLFLSSTFSLLFPFPFFACYAITVVVVMWACLHLFAADSLHRARVTSKLCISSLRIFVLYEDWWSKSVQIESIFWESIQSIQFQSNTIEVTFQMGSKEKYGKFKIPYANQELYQLVESKWREAQLTS